MKRRAEQKLAEDWAKQQEEMDDVEQYLSGKKGPPM